MQKLNRTPLMKHRLWWSFRTSGYSEILSDIMQPAGNFHDRIIGVLFRIPEDISDDMW